MAEGFLEIQTIIANGIEVYPTPNSMNASFGETVQVHIDFLNIGEMDTFLWEARDQYNNLLASQDIPGLPPNIPWEGNFSFEMPNENITITVNAYHFEEILSWWKFDEGAGNIAYDSISENDGTIYGANWATGKLGSALNFNGVDNYVDCGNDVSLNITNAISIECWINPNSAQEYCHDGIEGNYGVAGSADAAEGTTTWSWQLRYGSPDNCRLGFQFNEVGAGSKWVTVKEDLTPGTWYHIVGTYDGVNIKCYLNGVEKDTNTLLGIEGYLNKLLIGVAGWGEFNTYFDGKIDNFKIYNISLSPEEVQEHYQQGL